MYYLWNINRKLIDRLTIILCIIVQDKLTENPQEYDVLKCVDGVFRVSKPRSEFAHGIVAFEKGKQFTLNEERLQCVQSCTSKLKLLSLWSIMTNAHSSLWMNGHRLSCLSSSWWSSSSSSKSTSPNSSSEPNVAKAISARKKKCEMVCAMNLLTGQRSFSAICRHRTFRHFVHTSLFSTSQIRTIDLQGAAGEQKYSTCFEYISYLVIARHLSVVTLAVDRLTTTTDRLTQQLINKYSF